jgi:hypothetical protein
MEKRTIKQDRPFGQGITSTAPGPAPAPRHTTPKAIERRLHQLLKGLVEDAGGYLTTLEDIGEGGICGLALTLKGGEAFDIIIREARS